VAVPDPNVYWEDDYVVLDFETTTDFKGSPLVESNRLILACWTRGKQSDVKHTFGSEYDMGALVHDINEARFLVAHNAKFELGWLRRCGVNLHEVIVYDTLLGEYIIGGNRYNLMQLSLNESLKRYGLEPKRDIIGLMLKAGHKTEDMPRSWLLDYCKRDVKACEELFLAQREKLKESNLLHLQYQRCLVTPCLVDMEFQGIQIDETKVRGLLAEVEDEYARKTAELQEFMGGIPPSSTPQKCAYVYDTLKFRVPRDWKGREMLTPKGGKSISAEVLKRLKPENKRQEEWLRLNTEWAELNSDVTKYLRKFLECCDEADGLMRAVFNQATTRTHRFSSSGLVYKVQFQNLNRRFKPIFKARKEGWLVGEADGAQLEFRIAAHMGRDKVALGDILNKMDIHSFTASVIGCSRQDAKAHTFKPLYGGFSGAPEVAAYYKAFAERYSGIADTQRGWTHKVLKDKKLRTEYGLLFHWPQCKMSKSGYIAFTTNIYNYPVQGFATAEIIPLALVCAWHRMRDLKSFLVNTVHDSIIAEIHPDEVDLWHEIARTCLIKDCYQFLQTLYKINLTVPLGAGVMIGSHWSNEEAKNSEVIYDAPAELYEDAARQEGML